WRASRAVSSGARDYSGDPSPQDGQHLALEPRIFPPPGEIAPARMRQRQEFGQVLAVRAHRLGERVLAARAEVVLLRVGADEKRELDARQRGAELRLPERRAARRRRQIGAVDRARIAK